MPISALGRAKIFSGRPESKPHFTLQLHLLYKRLPLQPRTPLPPQPLLTNNLPLKIPRFLL